MGTRRVRLGPTGEAVRQHLRDLRRRLGVGQRSADPEPVTLREVSERLSEAGRPLSLNTLSEIENGARRVDVDDLTAIARALQVSPLNLLLPTNFSRDELIEVTGLGWVHAADAWAWMRDGELPGAPTDPWSGDNLGAFLSRPRRHDWAPNPIPGFGQWAYPAFVRALARTQGAEADPGAARARADLDAVARATRGRLIEIGLLPEQSSAEEFQVQFEGMLLELLMHLAGAAGLLNPLHPENPRGSGTPGRGEAGEA